MQVGFGSLDIVRAELLNERYLFYFPNITNSSLFLDDIVNWNKTYTINVYGVIDFCVSNQDKVFVLSMSGLQALSVYTMINDTFTLNSSIPLLGLTF